MVWDARYSHKNAMIGTARARALNVIDIYGYRAHIQSSCAGAMERLAEDFAFFQSTDESGAHIIELLDEEPPYSEMPPLTANVYTPRNVSYPRWVQTIR